MKYTSQDREQLLRERELELRLKEIEAEVHRADLQSNQTQKENSKDRPTRSFNRDVPIVAKLAGFFMGGIVVIFTAQLVAGLSFFICIAMAGWLCFELGRKSS